MLIDYLSQASLLIAQVVQNQRDFILRLLNGKFGHLKVFYDSLGEGCDEEFRLHLEAFCNSHLEPIGQKWSELANQPSLH